MTWGLNTRTSATWGEENAPTLQEHFNCSQDFRCSLYGLLIFYLFARDPWCYANVTSSFQKFKECFVKCIVFASKELGSVLRPSPLCTDSLIIGWYVIRCSFEAMGNAAEFFFFQRSIRPYTMTDDMGCKRRSLKHVHLDCSCRNFHIINIL